MPYEILDPRFSEVALINVELERLHTGCRWAEGPVWFGDAGHLLWSDIPNDRMLRYIPDVGVSVYRSPANHTNGHTRDGYGRLVSCEHGARRVTRTEHDGTITVLADGFEGKRLNSPNDVVVHRDGSVWFTDPNYGIRDDYEGHKGVQEQPCQGVYRIDPASGAITRLVDDFGQPNGLAFSPDGSLLYIADSVGSHDPTGRRHIRRFRVEGDRLAGGEVFAAFETGVPDGIRCDTEGRVWSSAKDGVHVFHPDGTRLGKILVPEVVANLCFGGPRRNRLFITATTSLYAIYVRAKGC
ncbi:SMP-30/gluconolactonase/LRE family protein [Antarcticirhabdus aurantiaca]|uniref:SMP-30/gluconolactonase/LRE family protein n=1 Tax=Antarcticirhabdus aurantiaca TaxID=2606717 RepID=A0ACD4NPF1_9HYPH|nr:SMP-30/gluconolactonase/LRE family protein [Antarcticirhabdus aurantiaca]WAJ28688.1 SMP-30/gluconolactonase/LRE family protein [Jeongeuplla avenae]